MFIESFLGSTVLEHFTERVLDINDVKTWLASRTQVWHIGNAVFVPVMILARLDPSHRFELEASDKLAKDVDETGFGTRPAGSKLFFAKVEVV